MNEESSDEKYYNFADEQEDQDQDQDQENGQDRGQDADRSMPFQQDENLIRNRLRELVQQRVEASKALRLNLITIVDQINVLSLAFVDNIMEDIEARHAVADDDERQIFIEIKAAQDATRSVLKVNEWLTKTSAEISTNLNLVGLSKSGAGQYHQNQNQQTQAHTQTQAMVQPQPQFQQLRDNRGLVYNSLNNSNNNNNNLSEFADQENRFHSNSNNTNGNVSSNGNGEHLNHNYAKQQPMKSDPKNEKAASSSSTSSSSSSFFFQDNQSESQTHMIFVNSIGKM